MSDSAHSLEKPTIIIMAGGTGGHIFPALATAQELRERGFHIHWLGTPDSMEAELVPKYGFDISYLPVTGLRGKGLVFLMKAPWKISVSLLRAMRILRQQKPVCVLGMGGYVTGPGGIAARMLRMPLIIHEQNAIVGFTNKILAKMSNRVLEAFPGTFLDTGINTDIVFHTGNPVRLDIQTTVGDLSKGDSRPVKLLIVGGSRGAQAFNKVVPETLAQLNDLYDGKLVSCLEVWHQTGKGNLDETLTLYSQHHVNGRVETFIDDMAEAYNWADIILCRSGALTVSELAVAGRPSILVPYPYAVDDHQTANGRYLVDQKAALMVQQNELNKDSLAKMLQELINDYSRLERMAIAARSVGKPESTRQVADHCMEVAHV